MPGARSAGFRSIQSEPDLEAISEGFSVENEEFNSTFQTVIEAEPPTIEPENNTTEDNASAAASISSVSSSEATEPATEQTSRAEAAKTNGAVTKVTNSNGVDPFEELSRPILKMASLKQKAAASSPVVHAKSVHSKPRSNSSADSRNKSNGAKSRLHSSADSLTKPNGALNSMQQWTG